MKTNYTELASFTITFLRDARQCTVRTSLDVADMAVGHTIISLHAEAQRPSSWRKVCAVDLLGL